MSTDSQLRQSLAEEAERTASLIHRTFAYVDTLHLLAHRRLTEEALAKLQRVNPGDVFRERSKAFPYVWRVEIQRPSQETLILSERLLTNHVIARVDISLDAIAASSKDANTVQEFFLMHGTQKWRYSRLLELYDGMTVYFAPAGTGRNMALYADRPSKVNQQPVAHADFRFDLARTCTAIGCRTATDLLHFDPDPHLRRQCRFSAINWAKAARVLEEHAGLYMRRGGKYEHIYPTDRTGCLNRLIGRVLHLVSYAIDRPDWAQRESFPVQPCLDALPVLRKCAVHIPLDHVIKSHIRLIWP